MTPDYTNFALLDDETPPVPAADVSIARAYGLRPYQAAGVEAVLDGFKDPEVTRQLFSAATGTGKTVIFSALASIMERQGGRTLILAHTEELIDQAIDKFRKTTGLRAAKEKAGTYASRFEKIVVGSVQSLCGDVRLSLWKPDHFQLVIVDECHRTLADSYQKILKHFIAGGALVVGFTATADRGDRRSLGEFYQHVAFDYNLLKACRDGWLVRPVVQTVPLNIDLRGVATKKTAEGTDFDRMEIGKRLAPFLDQIAVEIKARVGAKKVILFLPSVECATLMSNALNRANVSSQWVCGDKELCPNRTNIIKQHKAAQFQALCNMAVLTEGYDDDEIEYLVPLRPTKIRSLYAQMVGRGVRPLEEIVKALNAAKSVGERLDLILRSGKRCLNIIDFLWLYEKHDLVKPASLVAPNEKVANEMGNAEGDLISAEERAERDLLKKLEDELRKKANRKATVVDPLEIALALHDVELADYEPETARDAMEATPKQLRILQQNGLDTGVDKVTGKPKIWCRGMASALVQRVLKRHELGYATFRQLNFMRKLHLEFTPDMKRDEATAKIDAKIGKKPSPEQQGELPV